MKIISAGPFTARAHRRLVDLIRRIFLTSTQHKPVILTFLTHMDLGGPLLTDISASKVFLINFIVSIALL